MKPRTRSTAFVIIAGAVVFALLLHWCNERNTPIIAPYLDELAAATYTYAPILARFSIIQPMWIGPIEAAYMAAMIVAVILAVVDIRSNSSDRIEGKLAKRSAKKRQAQSGDDFAE